MILMSITLESDTAFKIQRALVLATPPSARNNKDEEKTY